MTLYSNKGFAGNGNSSAAVTRKLVTVVTPSFNQAAFLEETLQSVALQNHRPIQHVVVDGGSTDGSVDILKRYANEFGGSEYSLEWTSESDNGMADALAKGFARARGEIVGWLNSDDVYFDRFVVETVVQMLAKNVDVDVVFGDVALISETGGLWMFWCFPEFEYKRALRGYTLPQPGVFFRRSVVEQHSIGSLPYVGLDYAYWLEIGRVRRFRHVHRVQAADREHGRRRTHTLPQWAQEAAQLAVKYGEGYRPSSLEKFGDKITKMIMRLKGMASWARILSSPRIGGSIAFPLWTDSPWRVFYRHCTMRFQDRPELGLRPLGGQWPRREVLFRPGAKSGTFKA
jgi:glycosyltransferase involved in cell wall biosynthesis